MWAIQYYDKAADENQAREMLSACALQIDYIAGRVLPPSPVIDRNCWRVQALFHDAPDLGWFPDGIRRVLVLPGFLAGMLKTDDVATIENSNNR
jgi:hypothetical protein